MAPSPSWGRDFGGEGGYPEARLRNNKRNKHICCRHNTALYLQHAFTQLLAEREGEGAGSGARLDSRNFLMNKFKKKRIKDILTDGVTVGTPLALSAQIHQSIMFTLLLSTKRYTVDK
ncbi:hypothetical protein EYF80_025597 [Liparis tanakae]|uniref:Uncharacterized protein n=1 Tax=Liparis tanakae TaxID=230148 RepID=A0A4Z2HEG9_9TELE|nr:hypothetical protein EYF80_025597 [Liparis tanakae]